MPDFDLGPLEPPLGVVGGADQFPVLPTTLRGAPDPGGARHQATLDGEGFTVARSQTLIGAVL